MQDTSGEPFFDAVMVITSPLDCPGREIVGVVSLVMSSVADEPVSDAATKSGVSPEGTVESIDNGNAVDAVDLLPAGSVSVALTFQVPSVRVGNVQFDAGNTYEQLTVSVPFVAVKVMVSPVEPPLALTVGVLSFVLLSVLEAPVSDACARSTPVGAEGAVVSTVIDNAGDAADAPLVGFVSVAVIDHVP